jgi:hypothetical protein
VRRITSLSSVGRAPDCSCISTKRLSRHQGVPSSSLGAGTNNDRLVDDIFTTRLLKNIEQSLRDLEEGNNRNAKSVLKTFLEVMG